MCMRWEPTHTLQTISTVPKQKAAARVQVFKLILKNLQPDTKRPRPQEAIDIVLRMLHDREAAGAAGTSQNGSVKMEVDGAGGAADAVALPAGAGSGGKAGVFEGPLWVRTMKKVLTEDSASLQHVALLWQVRRGACCRVCMCVWQCARLCQCLAGCVYVSVCVCACVCV